MKNIRFVLTALLLCIIFLAVSCAGAGKYTVGICQQSPHKALDAASEGFRDALTAELGEGNVTFLLQDAHGESTSCTSIVNYFVSQRVDLILANATTALQAAVNGTVEIPILGTSVTDYGTVLGMDDFTGITGTNVSGTSDLTPLDEQAQLILTLFPDAKTVGLLYCSAEPNSDYQINGIRQHLEAKGIKCKDFPFFDSNEIASVAKAAAAASDVIYIPTDNTAASSAEAIGGAVLHTGTPIIGGDAGICGSCGIATICVDYYALGEQTAKLAAKILRGEAKIEEMPIEYAAAYQKLYNPTLCTEYGIDTAKLAGLGYTPMEN